MKEVELSDVAALESWVRDAPAKVAARREERDKTEVELWIAQHALLALARGGRLEFPVALKFDDKPDLVVQLPSGTVGVEIVELVPQAYAQAVVVRNREHPSAIVDRSRFGWDAKASGREIHAHLATEPEKLTGPGWAGEGVEQEWAQAAERAVATKLQRLNASGFDVHGQNWCLCYASSPGAAPDVQRAAEMVTLPAPQKGQRPFDRVLVLSGKHLVEFDVASSTHSMFPA